MALHWKANTPITVRCTHLDFRNELRILKKVIVCNIIIKTSSLSKDVRFYDKKTLHNLFGEIFLLKLVLIYNKNIALVNEAATKYVGSNTGLKASVSPIKVSKHVMCN